jgi:hypothetical protein
MNLFFWKDWPLSYRRFFWLLSGLFVLSVLFLFYARFREPAPAITWQFVEEHEREYLPIDTFRSGPFDLTIQGNNFFITERLLGNPLQPDEASAYLLIVALALAMVTTLAVITVLARLWYFVGAGLFILFIASLRLEILQMFGSSGKMFTGGVLVVFVACTYFFNAVKPAYSFAMRWFFFLLLTIVLAIVIFFFASVPRPFLHLGFTGVTPALVLTLIFIITVAHEIPASFVSIVTSGHQPSKSLRHFLVISTIYFVNLGLAYAYRFGYINWNFLYVDLFFLLAVSGILGVYGLRQRQPQMSGIMDAEPFALFLFLSVGTVVFCAVGFFTANANDPALAAIADVIIFAHLGFGIIFLTYVISNFFDILGNNLPAHRVLYKPARMPYFTFRFGGIVATLAFLLYNTWQVPVHNAQSAYYNAGGDLYRLIGDKSLARGFYEQAGTYGFLNHHSNYAMADLEAGRSNTSEQRRFLKRAVERRPTEMSWLNLSQTYQQEKNWLEASLVLRDAARAFPDSGPIQNTRGLLYAQLNIVDSAVLALTAASKGGVAAAAAKINIIALAARHQFDVTPDSMLSLLGATDVGVKANALAFANHLHQRIDLNVERSILNQRDSVLNLFTSTLLSNYLINRLGVVDSSFISQAIRIGQHSGNLPFSEPVLFASALALYADGQVARAFDLLEQVATASTDPGPYNHVLALWCLHQGDPHQAKGYLAFALRQNVPMAVQTSAIASSETGTLGEAVMMWDSVRSTADTAMSKSGNAMMRVLTASLPEALRFSDSDKYAFIRYRISLDDPDPLISLISTMNDDDLKARAIIDFAYRFYQADDDEKAIQVLQHLTNLRLRDQRTLQEFRRLEMLLAALQRDFRFKNERLKSYPMGYGSEKVEQYYFETLSALAAGDSTEAAQRFDWLSRVNPFFDDGIVSAADYFRAQADDNLRAYNILVEALHRHPGSIKIGKAYVLEAQRLGFDEYVSTAMAQLQRLMTPRQFSAFLQEVETAPVSTVSNQ